MLTIAAPDLQRFKITPAGHRRDRRRGDVDQRASRSSRTDGKVGILGISFSGGLSIVAAGRDSIRDRVAFVMSFGGHGDLARVMHYLMLRRGARRSRDAPSAAPRCSAPITSACIRRTTTAWRSSLLSLADRVVPADQVEPLSTRHRRIPARLVAGGHRSAEGDPGVRGDEEIRRRRCPSRRGPT